MYSNIGFCVIFRWVNENTIKENMKILFLILKIWLIGLIIVLPIVISFCKSATLGDKGNELVNKKN